MVAFGKKQLFGAALLSFISISCIETKSARALEADCFVQPPNAVPIPCLADSSGHQIIVTVPEADTTTDSSGGIITGGTFQTIAGINGARKSIEFANLCNVAGNCTNVLNKCYLYIGSGVATVANSLPIDPGGGYIRSSGTIPADAIKATCDGNGDVFYLRVQ